MSNNISNIIGQFQSIKRFCLRYTNDLLLTICLSPLLDGVNNNLVLTQCDQVLPSAVVTVKLLSASLSSSCDTIPVI